MSELNFIPKAIELVKLAVDEDNAENYEKAKFYYTQSLDYFMTGLKYEKNERSKAAIRERMKEYMHRAEQIDELIKQRSEAPAPAAAAGKKKSASGGSSSSGDNKSGGKDKDEDDKDDVDPETKKLEASLSHAIVSEKPNVKWDDVAGLDNAKKLIQEAVMVPLRFPHLFTGKRKAWRGILLYGPPGTGKSHLARAVATEVGDATFFSISAADLVSKYQGESERLVQGLWSLARKKKPAIVFMDEVDSLLSSRKDSDNDATTRIKTQLLIEFDGVNTDNTGVVIIGATNNPWSLDTAVRRRFEKRIYIPLPDERARVVMLKVNLGTIAHSLTDEQFLFLAQRTEGFSGADMSIMVREALMEPIRAAQDATHFRRVAGPAYHPQTNAEDYVWQPCSPADPNGVEMTMFQVPAAKLKPLDISLDDFLKALRTTRPSVNMNELSRYDDWTTEFGQEG